MTDRSTNDGAWTPSDLTSAALDATAGFSTAELRALASRGGLAALIEAVRSALVLLEYDRNALFESNRQPSTNEVTDPDARAELVEYDTVIKAFRALLPPVGERETPAAESETQHSDRVCVTLDQVKKAWSAADWARAGSGSGTKGMTKEQMLANEELRDDAWCHTLAELLGLRVVGQGETPTDHANVSPLPDAEAEALGIPNPGGMISSRDRVLGDIEAERRRQIWVEGWTPEHDDSHQPGELARAAGCYAWCAFDQHHWRRAGLEPGAWPGEAKWWKPKGPRRDLVRAAALIVAEIERIDRADALSKREGES